MNTSWSELVATALMGTDRRPAGATDPAAEALDLAASVTAYRRAGHVPTTVDDLPTPAPVETSPLVSMAAAARLTALLDAAHQPWDPAAREPLITEWLALADERGLRVPPFLLPALLDHGRRRAEARGPIGSVGGARARWLAALNPDWAYLVRGAAALPDSPAEPPPSNVDDELEWRQGTRPERLAHLRRLRRLDPAAASRRLDQDWPNLSPDERVELITTMDIGLSGADEELLERALDDRRAEVRTAALGLLIRLPDAAYQTRMAQRAIGYLHIGPDGDLAVSAPAECDRSMRRDGILVKPPAGTGERAWWLEQVLARAPLSAWPEPPQRFLARPVADDWAATVHRGLGQAAAARRDSGWAAAIVDRLGAGPRDREVAAALYPQLDPADLARRTIEGLGQGETARWGALLQACPVPWPDALATAVMRGLIVLLGRPNLTGDLHQLCRLAAVRLPAHIAPAARGLSQRAPAEFPGHRSYAGLDNLAAVLTFRQAMTKELAMTEGAAMSEDQPMTGVAAMSEDQR